MNTESQIKAVCEKFQIKGEYQSYTVLVGGHINSSYQVFFVRRGEIKDYIFKSLQIKTNKRTGVSIIAENDQSKSLVNSKLKFIDTKYDLLSYGDKDVETFLGVAKW